MKVELEQAQEVIDSLNAQLDDIQEELEKALQDVKDLKAENYSLRQGAQI